MPPRLLKELRAAPIAVPCAVVIALLTWWEADGAGFPVDRWAPGLLLVLGLLAISAITIVNPWGDVPRPVVLAAGLLAAFTLWSYASIAWASDAGAALEDANRTLLYLLLFSLFALWRLRGAGAYVLVAAWTLGLVAIAAVTTVRLGALADPTGLFFADRLATPVDYPNAAAATFAMALWPALVLAASSRVHPLVRALCGGGAVLLADLALLAQSRGALIAIPLTGLVCLAVVPGRLRLLVMVAGLGAGVGLSAPVVLDVATALTPTGDGAGAAGAIAEAARRMLVAAGLIGALTAVVAAVERARPPKEATRAKVGRVGGIVAAGGTVVALVVALAVVGNPIDRLDSGWQSFKGGYEQEESPGASRLTSGLGSNRYDFYRVAADEFTAAPLIGQGAGAFREAYLVDGASSETPRYPHSVEMKVLSQTGLVGALLLLAALGAAAWAAWRGLRAGGRDPALRAATGGAALMATTYVFAHGSADWFWETAGLTGPAFALLGLAAGLCPRPVPPRALVTRARTPGEVVGVVLLAVQLAVIVGAPWLAQRELGRASDVFAQRPLEAYSRLDRAASLNPFSDDPALLKGTIALRYEDLPRAEQAFTAALRRVPQGQYATLQRGAIASALGNRADAERLLRRARALAPRDPIAREALEIVRDGGTIDLANLARRILGDARSLNG